ncbi:hypothetical protein [Actinokineospora sp. NBRC 105648]|uniref:hypothetical protein n=1 Tax=Actinokineospora sp. NBRC 105648 TaxID=3032206 RepID=UPI0024A2C477|nr:hypothetical protein [Actinokineospora sp. NBRC 105648]GLZ38208.1 hypothetical protein Acsp05_18320 [Actinokineospora sp. NBRC 105648]
MTVPPLPEPTSPSRRPVAVTGAVCGAVGGAGLSGLLLVFADRSLGYLGLGAGLSALVALVLALPLRAGRNWARLALMATALLGALCAPAAANAHTGAMAPYLGGVLIVLWIAVVTLLLRLDSREYFAAALPTGEA